MRSQRIRVLIVAAQLAVGGAEISLLELVRRLDRDRFDLAICALGSGGALVPAFRELDLPMYELGVAPGLREARGAGIVRVIARHRPQVIHARLILPSLWARVGHLFGARVLTDEVGIASSRPPLVIRLDRLTQAFCDLWVANSRAIALRLRERERVPASRIRVIYFGIDLSRHRTGRDGHGVHFDLITVARIERYKGVFDLVDAMERLVARRPGTTLALVGDGSERTALEREIVGRHLDRSISLLGQRSDVPELLADARVFILPSHEEGLSVAIQEAMAAGLPVVATDVGGSAEAVLSDRTGALVPARDPDALAGAALRYLEDPQLARAHGMAAEALAKERFGVERMVREYEAVYELLGSAGARSGGRTR